jgi:hypothetical protein
MRTAGDPSELYPWSVTGNSGEQHDADRRPSGSQLRAQTCVMAIVTLSMAIWLCTQIANMKSCCLEKCLTAAILPAVLTVVSVGLFVLAHELGRDGWGRGGGGGDGPDAGPSGPVGGIEFDWDGFETEFWAYVDRQYTLV